MKAKNNKQISYKKKGKKSAKENVTASTSSPKISEPQSSKLENQQSFKASQSSNTHIIPTATNNTSASDTETSSQALPAKKATGGVEPLASPVIALHSGESSNRSQQSYFDKASPLLKESEGRVNVAIESVGERWEVKINISDSKHTSVKFMNETDRAHAHATNAIEMDKTISFGNSKVGGATLPPNSPKTSGFGLTVKMKQKMARLQSKRTKKQEEKMVKLVQTKWLKAKAKVRAYNSLVHATSKTRAEWHPVLLFYLFEFLNS